MITYEILIEDAEFWCSPTDCDPDILAKVEDAVTDLDPIYKDWENEGEVWAALSNEEMSTYVLLIAEATKEE